MNFIKKISTPAQLLLLATLVAEPGCGQFIVEGESAEVSVCGAADCVIISRCSAVLSLVLKVIVTSITITLKPQASNTTIFCAHLLSAHFYVVAP